MCDWFRHIQAGFLVTYWRAQEWQAYDALAGSSKRHLICDSSGCVGEIFFRGRNPRRGMGVTTMLLRWDE